MISGGEAEDSDLVPLFDVGISVVVIVSVLKQKT